MYRRYLRVFSHDSWAKRDEPSCAFFFVVNPENIGSVVMNRTRRGT